MSTQETQARLLGGPSGDSASIKTSGRVIRPAMEIPDALVDEARARFSNDGVCITAVDPSNVGLVNLDIQPEAFEAYAVDVEDELVVGFKFNSLTNNLSNARLGKSTDDPVEMGIDSTRTVVEVTRDYSGTSVRYADEQLNIDPDAIREDPDFPDLNLNATAEVDVDAFKDAVEHVDTSSDYVSLIEMDGSLWLTTDASEDSPSDYGTAVELEDVVEVEGEPEEQIEAKFSNAYLVDFVRAVKSSKADSLTLNWDREMPLIMEFERTIDDELAYSAEFMLAPRVHQ